MFLFSDSEIALVAINNDLREYLYDLKNCGEISEEEYRFIGYYSLNNPYKKSFTEVQRYDYIRKMNHVLKMRNSLPIYSFVEE